MIDPGGLGVCPSNPSLRGKGAAGRCREAAGSKKPEAYSLEYVEDFFGPRTTQHAGRSFAAVEWHYSDRLLGFHQHLHKLMRFSRSPVARAEDLVADNPLADRP